MCEFTVGGGGIIEYTRGENGDGILFFVWSGYGVKMPLPKEGWEEDFVDISLNHVICVCWVGWGRRNV